MVASTACVTRWGAWEGPGLLRSATAGGTAGGTALAAAATRRTALAVPGLMQSLLRAPSTDRER